jgi:hypothetical protein
MSISDLSHASSIIPSAAQRREQAPRRPFHRLSVGQMLDLKVLQKIADGRFLVQFDGGRHIVETAMTLRAGSTLHATVAAIGERLELKYIDAPAAPTGPDLDVPSPDDDTETSEDPALLDDLQQQYDVVLSYEDRRSIATAMQGAAEPTRMANAGLFLGKLLQPIGDEALQAVYSALSWSQRSTSMPSAATDASALLEQLPNAAAVTTFGESLADSLSPGDRELAERLLNEQDEGSMAYSYGTVPLLIADQLIELDVVMFRERNKQDAQTAVRRLVMTLRTQTLGRVEVMAQAVGQRLTIALTAESASASDSLAQHADEVRELIGRLGWQVESIRYDVDGERARAADHIVRHVLSAGTVDCMV